MIPSHETHQKPKAAAGRKKAAPRGDQPNHESRPAAAPSPAGHEQAARSVMHPDSFDPEWRYYHGAWGG